MVAALLRGSPEVARSLTRLHCWPSDSFAVAYDELARQGQLHRLLLLAQQPVLLLEHVLSCTTGDSSDTARLRLVAMVTAVAGRPAENNILTLMVEVERRARDRRPRQHLYLVEQLRVVGAADFARKLDASIARGMCYTELSVVELLECLGHNRLSGSPGATPERRPESWGALSHTRRAIMRELCRRCCGPNRVNLDGLSHTIIVEMLRYGCPGVLAAEPRASSRSSNVLSPTAVAILQAFLCGTPTAASWTDTPQILCDYAGGRLLQRFVRGVVACVSGSWQHARKCKDLSADGSHISSELLGSVFEYAPSVQMLLVTTAGRRVLRHVAEEHRSVAEQGDATHADHDFELSFSWGEVQKLQEQASTSVRLDNETSGRLAHYWLFLASRDSQASDVWSQWHAVIGDPGAASQPAASRLRSTLTDILDLIMWPDARPGRGIKRDRKTAESNAETACIQQRVKHNLPLLGCLHSLIDTMAGTVHNLPDLHHEAVELCTILLDAFDAIVIDALQLNMVRQRVRQPDTVNVLAETGRGKKSVDTLRVHLNCIGAIVELVHSVSTFVHGLDEECCALVYRHHTELILSRFVRLGGVPPIRIFAAVAVHVTRSMFLDAGTAGRQLHERDDGRSHGQLWRLFGEIVLQLRSWYVSHDEEEADALSTDCLNSLLAVPACQLVQLPSCHHSNPSYGVEQKAWYTGVVRELLLCLHGHPTDAHDCDLIIVSVLDALIHLVSSPCQQELAALWECVDGAAASASHGQHGTFDMCNSNSAAAEVMITCANLLLVKCRDTSRIQGRHAPSDRCCARAVEVMLSLLRATAMASLDEMQYMSIRGMLTETEQPTASAIDVVASLIECGFGNEFVGLRTSAACARCLQYVAGLHDALAVSILTSNALFSDKVLAWGVARMEQAELQPAHTTAPVQHNRKSSCAEVEAIEDVRDMYELVSSVAGLLAHCAERASSSFRSQFGDDVRFFTLLRCMLDIVLLRTGSSNEGNLVAPMSHVEARAATHALRLVGNVADAVTFASKLNLAGVAQRLQLLADKGGEVGLTSEGCARVAQIVRAIAS